MLRWEGSNVQTRLCLRRGGGYIRRSVSLSRELKQGINCLLRAAGDGRGRIGIDDHLYSTLLSVSSAPQRRIGTTAPEGENWV